MTLTLIHHYNRAVEVGYARQPLFTYVYVPDMPQSESPKPYFHPLNTLGGNELSCYRPYDHPWHKGLQMTVAHLRTPSVEAQNFWGGGSYVHGRGYVQLPNNGSMLHGEWRAVELQDDAVLLSHSLNWITEGGDRWIGEERQIRVSDVDEDESRYNLDFQTSLTNVWREELLFGSPTTAGRPQAGYGSLFWRGPRSFTQSGKIRTAGGLSTDDVPESEIMGSSSAWLAYEGRHDVSGNRSALVFLDHPANLRHPTQWFVRRDPYACVSFAFSFDEEYSLAPGASLTMKYRIVVCEGEVSEKWVEEQARVWSAV